ncbi:MAG: SAM-dependent methyltransferase, partial [Helicobacter sp.]|nr:SAM-dependent methyltransferase [Helicobacter sp.]
GDFLTYDFLHLRFDRIISNPPFYHSVVIKSSKETIYEARYEENLPFELMVKKVGSLLKSKGEFIFCYDCKSSYKLFYGLMQYNIRPITIRFVYPKIDRESTLILCRAKKDSKSEMQVLPPLFTHDEKGFTKEVQEIYARADTWSIKC